MATHFYNKNTEAIFEFKRVFYKSEEKLCC